MLGQGETVGHSGNEIADPAGPVALVVAFRPHQPFRRQVSGRFQVFCEQVEQNLLTRITRLWRYMWP